MEIHSNNMNNIVKHVVISITENTILLLISIFKSNMYIIFI